MVKSKKDIREILRKLCVQKGVEIIEAEACADHIHMLVSIPPHISVSQFMGYLKGKSSLMIFDRHANLKYKYGSRTFWCRGYYLCIVITQNIKKYVSLTQFSNSVAQEIQSPAPPLKRMVIFVVIPIGKSFCFNMECHFFSAVIPKRRSLSYRYGGH